MQEARMIGYRVQKQAESQKISFAELSSVIGCSEAQFKSFIKGRAFVSFKQLSLLAQHLKVDVATLLSGDEEDYNRSVVHCMNDFSNDQNREKILDIIDEYMDLVDSIS